MCTYTDADGADTVIQPVFIVDGSAYTTADWYQAEGSEHGVEVFAA